MLDRERLCELRDEVGAQDFGDIVEVFLEEVEEALITLAADPRPDQMEGRLHFLKGSALNIGFSSFAQLCQRGETDARQGRNAVVDLAAIQSSYAASKSQLSGLMAGF